MNLRLTIGRWLLMGALSAVLFAAVGCSGEPPGRTDPSGNTPAKGRGATDAPEFDPSK